jgi:hypothetical protein
MARSNRMKELIQKNKLKHRLGPGGYKATIPLWTKKEQKLCELGYRNPMKVAHCAREIGSQASLI